MPENSTNFDGGAGVHDACPCLSAYVPFGQSMHDLLHPDTSMYFPVWHTRHRMVSSKPEQPVAR